eukprot:COSAG02_NODE_29043_length_577_cov_0.723849_1_plen_87_part_01
MFVASSPLRWSAREGVPASLEMVVEARRLRSFLTKWLHLRASNAFTRWISFVAESQREKEIIGNLNRQLADQCKKIAFGVWLDTVRA